MTKFQEALVRVAYVAKMLLAIAGVTATALLGVTGLPVAWKVPLMAVAAVATAVSVFKVPNGPDLELARALAEYKRSQKSGGDVE